MNIKLNFFKIVLILSDKHINNIMIKNLVIVESPAKARTIEKFLGNDFVVKSSFGHVRDLSKKDLGVDIEKDFTPFYEISVDKIKIVNELKKAAKEAELVWLASDEDREGEAIAWHLSEALSLKKEKIRRIVFHEITKPAILDAVANPRGIDYHLVDAQQARRVLDRLVGFEISPILWRKIKPSLSAGRVQSVAVRLIVEREQEIKNFLSVSSIKVTALFDIEKSTKQLNAELNERFKTLEEARRFLEICIPATYKVKSIETKPAKKSPSSPFTTSTLQQEASRKLGMSVERVMQVAQKLYESGKITYMRTDSVNMSELAIGSIKKEIANTYGEEYVKIRRYQTKSKGAQEAHEAIRPSYINQHEIEGDALGKKLYDLIWKRTIASQMSDAILEKTNVTIDVSTSNNYFIAEGEVVKFDGFLKIYMVSNDDETEEDESKLLPPIRQGEKLELDEMKANEKFSQQPARYTEASLVRKLEELGIGRPSTYAPTISTIQKRGYVVRQNKEGFERKFALLSLKKGKIKEEIKTEKTGYEKAKIFPTDIGSIVNDFLVLHFKNILDFHFTAKVEKEFDDIAQGNLVWNEMIKKFYLPFHKQVDITLKVSERVSGERLIGKDPESGRNVYSRLGKFGPIVQLGESDNEEKVKFASLKKDQSIDSISLDDALELFKLPRISGIYEQEEMMVAIGKFGPYIKHKEKFYSIEKTDDPYNISQERCIEVIEEKLKKTQGEGNSEFPINLGSYKEEDISILIGRFGIYLKHNKSNYPISKKEKLSNITKEKAIEIIEARIENDKNKVIKTFPENTEIKILNGFYGPYIVSGKENYRIPKGNEASELSLKDCLEIIGSAPEKKGKKTFVKKNK